MSAQLATERQWNSLAAKQKIKDSDLAKALALYGKADEEDPAAQVAALEKVEKCAEALKKENKKNKDAVDSLDKMLSEVDKVRKKAEAEAKKKKDDDDEDEGEDDAEIAEYKADLGKKLVTALNQVKSRAPGELAPGTEAGPQLKFAAYLVGRNAALLVAKKTGGAAKKLLIQISGGVSGGKHLKGECIFEKNAHTFVLEKLAPGLAKKFVRSLRDTTGKKYKVRVRTFDGSAELDDETDIDPDAAPEAGSPLPPSPPQMPAPPAQDADLAAAYRERLTAIMPALQRALKEQLGDTGKIRALMEFIREKAGAGNFTSALQALVALEKLLGATGTAQAVSPEPATSVTDSTAAMAVWQKARAAAIDQLRGLGAAIKAAKDPEADQALIVLEAIVKNLTETPATAQMVKELERYIETDDIVTEAELPNPFGPALSLRAPLLEALAPLKAGLEAKA